MQSTGSRIAFIVLALVTVPERVIAVREQRAARMGANPIRKVVTMLQAMQKKVTEEGEHEQKLYSDFMCYCKTGGGNLAASIAAAETKIPAVKSAIDEAEAKLTQTKSDLKNAQEDRSAAKAAMAEATSIREKEAAEFATEKAEYDSNIDAIMKAVAALEKGVSGGFLQTEAAQVLRQLVVRKRAEIDSAEDVLAFLSAKEGSSYVPQSSQVIGILKQMGDEMAKGLAEATAAEQSAIQSYEALMSAKKKEVAALSASVESKLKLVADLGVEIAQMKEDLSDTEEALLEDQEFLANLKQSCATKTSEWEERSKTRADELVALAETIKILNDDDALELFKKTLPSSSASLLQVQKTSFALRARALAEVRAVRRTANFQDRANLDLLVLALTGKKALNRAGFEKVIKMCDEMVEVLKKEQQDDDRKKEYCTEQFDLSDDTKKGLERTVADEENAISKAEEGIATTAEEIAALEAAIKALDKSVAEATEQRKAENVEFKELMASNTAAKEIIGLAKNRLMAFYNKKLYKASPKAELSRQDRIVTNLGGVALVQTSEHGQHRDAPPPPPATWGAYEKKSEETSGVVEMMGLLVKDLDKEMTEAETAEKDAQADYEIMMKDAAETRAADSKSLTDKKAAKADIESALQASKEAKASATKELMATEKYISELHASCDWLLQYFDVRKEARASEVDALNRAKAVLSGADYSLLQTSARGFLGR